MPIIRSGLQTINLPETTPYRIFASERDDKSWSLMIDLFGNTPIFPVLEKLTQEEAEQMEWSLYLLIEKGEKTIILELYLDDHRNGMTFEDELKPKHLKIASQLPAQSI